MIYALSGHTVTAENLMFSKMHNTNRYRNLTNKLKTKWCSKISEGSFILVKFSRYVKIDFVHYLHSVLERI